MNFNQKPESNSADDQMKAYFQRNQNKWYAGSHELIAENHPVHTLTLDDHFFEPSVDKEESLNSTTLDSFFTDKLELNRLHVSGLISQIHRRNNMKDENLYRIDKDMMKCQSKLFEIEHIPKWYNANITRTRNTLEKEILALEKEKRAEYVSWWRDLVLIKKDLINTFKEFKSAEQRQNLVLDMDAEPQTESDYFIPHNDYHH